MKVGMARDLALLRTITATSTAPMGDESIREALQVITRALETLAREVEQADYTATATQSALRRYGMR